MSTPCEQAKTIDAISVTLQRMEKGQERVVELLTHVANQDVRINHLETSTQRHHEYIEEVFDRLRKVELNLATNGAEMFQKYHDVFDLINKKLERLHRFLNMVTSRPAQVLYAVLIVMTITGTALDFLYHYDRMITLLRFLRG